MSKLKLEIELVPETLWGQNLWHLLPRKDWDKIRKSVYAEYNYQCGICGKKATLAAHEIWHYDDRTRVQTLKGLIALCGMCHHVKHFGLSQKLAAENRLNLKAVIAHFMRINDCDYPTFEKHWFATFYVWKRRSRSKWKSDLSYLEKLRKTLALPIRLR